LTEEQYEECLKLVSEKVIFDKDIDWEEIKEKHNLNIHRDTLRKASQTIFGGAFVVEYYKQKNIIENKDDDYIDDMITQKYELKQERIKFRDERTYVEKLLREVSRIDNLKEIAVDFAKQMNTIFPFVDTYKERETCKRTGILNISDWHFGIEVDNFINKYNSDIFKERINKLVQETIKNINEFKLEKLYVIGLSDYISGIIHYIIRLENRENVIQQIMIVSETIAEMLNEFSKIIKVEYYDVLDNHSRVHANKKESMSAESFMLLIRWYLNTRFENSKTVTIHENEFDDEICTFNIYGFNYLGVHGHIDSVSNVVQNMSLMTKRFYDCVFTAHKHHMSSDETHKCYIYANPCLSGVDAHSKDLRVTSRPAQNLFIVSEDDCIEYVRTIKLD
jgi:hypothetical protein